jgi:6-phosphofructokinase
VRSSSLIIIKAEGVAIAIDRLKALVDARLRDKVPDADPSGIETRVTVLGHVVRGAALAETAHLLRGTTPLARWRAGAFDDIEDALLL